MFATYNQELNRDQAVPSYKKLRKMVGQHIDQTVRTRNSKARNGRNETGKVIRVKMSAQKEKWETAISGRHMHSARKEIPLVLTTGLVVVKEHNHPLLLRRRRLRLKKALHFSLSTRSESSRSERQKTVSKLSESKVHGMSM